MKVRFLRPARDELREAIQYLNEQREGLGGEFLVEVRSVVDRIERHPEARAPIRNSLRRCRTRRFKYGLIYEVQGDEILVIAVANLHREPDYWRDRK
ncbi:MAG: type II toxin-antitoxin system RelE/ParE family toxin [Gammaproteobacteria bacterium]